MAIARDSEVDMANGASPFTFNHTCATGAVLYVFVRSVGDLVTAVTYNSVAMTQLIKVSGVSTVYIYGLLAPASGTNTVSVSTSVGSPYAGSASYTGVDANAFSGITTSHYNPGGTGDTLTMVTTVDNSALLGFAYNDTNTVSAGAGTAMNGSGVTGMGAFDSSPISTGTAGSKSLVWTIAPSTGDCTSVAIAMAPATSGVIAHFLSALGAGA